jgi:hypothetical protein
MRSKSEMNLSNYKIPFNPLGQLSCQELLDFRDYPILTLEEDNTGRQYLSYLVEYLPHGREQRILASISAGRLLDVQMGTISVRSIYDSPSSGPVYAFEVDEKTGIILDCYVVPLLDFRSMNPIPVDFRVYCPPSQALLSDASARALANAKDRHRVLIDIYAHGKVLAAGIKPWTIRRVFEPVVDIVQRAFDLPESKFNDIATFSCLQVGSLSATIELDYGNLFTELDYDRFALIIELINARSRDDFLHLVGRFRNEGFLKEYLSLVNAVKKYDLSFNATLANPVTAQVIEAHLDQSSASEVRKIINTTFDAIVDIEDVEGVFLDLDFSIRIPSFVIQDITEESRIRGRIDAAISKKLRDDQVNLTRTSYVFTIRTIYQPETSLRPERTEKWLIDYRVPDMNLHDDTST